MQQLVYTIDENHSGQEMASDVRALPAYQRASSRLQIVLEPNHDNHEAMRQNLLDARAELPGTTCVGMTLSGPLNATMQVPAHTRCTFLLFEHGTVHARSYDCHEMSPTEAGKRFCNELTNLADIKGILCFTAGSTTSPTPFLETLISTYPDLPIFGSMAGASTVLGTRSAIFHGNRILDFGIVAVALCGEDLQVMCNYNLGWRPIGRELTITGYEGNGVVSRIDDDVASAIYRHYLDVGLNERFIENTCAFPLIMQDGKYQVARIPLGYLPDGKLQFGMDLRKGAVLRLSYTKPEYLLSETMTSANAMLRFAPQGILLFACLGRREFLGNKLADRELSYFQRVCPTAIWASGYGEILHTTDGGGILNNSIVAVGIREGAIPTDYTAVSFEDPLLQEEKTFVPLEDRLVTFLEATTSELSSTIGDLAHMATHDQLTGVYNRRRMDELIRYELSKRRTGDDLVLIMYDIDHFKRINDTYGHNAGDRVLYDLTRLVDATIRSGDSLGRWGGEEFLCLLTGTSLANGSMVAERIRSRVAAHDFTTVGRVTISLGVVRARKDDTLESLFSRVDKALYDAKEGGRNRVCVG